MSSSTGEERWWTLSPEETRRPRRWPPSLEGGPWGGLHDSKACFQFYFPNYLFSEFGSSHSSSPWPPDKGPEAPLHSIHEWLSSCFAQGSVCTCLGICFLNTRISISSATGLRRGWRHDGTIEWRHEGGRDWAQGESPLLWAHSTKAELCQRLFGKGNV